MSDTNINVSTGLSVEQFGHLNRKLDILIQGEQRIMTDQELAQKALDQINAATTLQGTVLAAEGDTLKKISDEIDVLLAAVVAANGRVSADQLARLQVLANASDAISVSLQAQADASTAIASKGAADPVPVPVPAPTPAPESVPAPEV